MKYIISASNCI